MNCGLLFFSQNSNWMIWYVLGKYLVAAYQWHTNNNSLWYKYRVTSATLFCFPAHFSYLTVLLCLNTSIIFHAYQSMFREDLFTTFLFFSFFFIVYQCCFLLSSIEYILRLTYIQQKNDDEIKWIENGRVKKRIPQEPNDPTNAFST